MMDTNMVKGLFFLEKRRNNLIQMRNFLFGKRNTGACFREDFSVLFPGFQRFIISFFQSTGGITSGTAVADIRTILVLDHGRIIERGNHRELLARKGRYYALYTGAAELS